MRSKLVISSVNECKLKSLSKRQQKQLKRVIIDRISVHKREINHYKGSYSNKRLKNLPEYYILLTYSDNNILAEYSEEVLLYETNFILDCLIDIVNKYGAVSLALDLSLFISSFDGIKYRIAYSIGLDLATEIELFLDSLNINYISRGIKRAKSRRERINNISSDLNLVLSDKQRVETG